MIHKGQKILCCCRGGQVRSVAARKLLSEDWGFRKVLTCGLEKNDYETIRFLVDWADAVLVVASQEVFKLFPESLRSDKVQFLEVGPDVWGWHKHPELTRKIGDLLERIVQQ